MKIKKYIYSSFIRVERQMPATHTKTIQLESHLPTKLIQI